jgi:hypothetical protein
MPFNLCLISPVRDGVTVELGAVIAHHHLRRSALQHQLVEFSGYASARKVSVCRQFDAHTVQASITLITRKRRQSVDWSDTKSSDHPCFGNSGNSIGARVPRALLRPPRLRTDSFSSQYSRNSLLWFTSVPSRLSMMQMRRQPRRRRSWAIAFIRSSSLVSSTLTDAYRTVIRQHCKSWHAHRSLILCLVFGWATASRSARGITIFSTQIFQCNVVQHGIRKQSLQLGIIVLKVSQPLGLGHIHPTELGFPLVNTGIADTVLAAHVRNRNPGLVLLKYPDNLLFCNSTALHSLVLVCLARANFNMD